MPIRSIPPGGSIRRRPRRRGRRAGPALSRTPRIWVFAQEPAFARFQRTLRVQRVDEPAIDVFDQANQVTLIAQLPGASMEEMDLHIEDDLVAIEAMATLSVGRVKYYREVLLPFEVEAVPQKWAFNNGIMEVELKRKGAATEHTETRSHD